MNPAVIQKYYADIEDVREKLSGICLQYENQKRELARVDAAIVETEKRNADLITENNKLVSQNNEIQNSTVRMRAEYEEELDGYETKIKELKKAQSSEKSKLTRLRKQTEELSGVESRVNDVREEIIAEEQKLASVKSETLKETTAATHLIEESERAATYAVEQEEKAREVIAAAQKNMANAKKYGKRIQKYYREAGIETKIDLSI